ncbi:SurA N-terminal domain-containing protein [Paludibacteraceae bacterium OttesenSCG-928-F17]|nr:SurA N-terminal domain-containing protein [Paludibacteraceae bacterium OttesenSCG-928-F17]
MATLEKIRSKGPLLVAVIGIALLAFIIGDFLNSGVTYFNSNRENVAVIEGENINIREFQSAIDQLTEVYKIQSNTNDVSEEVHSQIRFSVWDNLVRERLYKEEANKIGLTISKEELSDRLIGNNIHPVIMQMPFFQNESRQFDRSLLLNFLNYLDQDANSNEMAQQQEQLKIFWLYWENAIKNNILEEKYNDLIAKSITANSIDAKANFETVNIRTDFEYITQPYYMVPDSVVTISNTEVKNYYNKNKELYKQDASRSITYTTFDLKPLEEDYKQVQEWMNNISNEFATTNDIVGLVNSNSDVMYDGYNYSERTAPAVLKDFAFSGKEGDIFGPVFQNDTHTMAKIMETGINRPDSVKLSHIYFYPGEETLADSVYNVLVKTNADFETLVAQYSQMNETKANNGDIGYLVDGMKGIDKDFLTAFDRKEGEIFKFSNANGTQIVKVTEKTQAIPKVKLAILERKVTPSSRSQAKIYNDAKQFAVSAKNLDDFNRLATEYNVAVRPANNLDENAERIASLPQSRQIVRWVFSNDLNSVSDVFDTGNQFVIAIITEVNKKGYATLEKVTPQIQAELRKEKKAAYIIDNMSAKLAANKSLGALANELRVDVRNAENVTFISPQFGNSGSEPYVVGKAMKVQMNTVSAPIKGNSGVFVVHPINTVDNTATIAFNAEEEINQLNARNQYSISYLVYDNLRKKAEIVDNRSNFY